MAFPHAWGRKVLIAGLLTAAVAFPFASAQALTGSGKVTVTKAIMQSCIKSMKANQGGNGLTDAKINGYCSCMGTETASELQPGEVQRYFNSGGTATVGMRDMNARIGRQCSRYLR
jgi:hypothetical protein